MRPLLPPSPVRYLVAGPALLVGASLIDLFLATRVFVHPDPLIGALSFFIFGALSGLPCQLALARSPAARWLEPAAAAPLTEEQRKAARTSGVLGAFSTAAWLYALGVTAPALVFPLANLNPVVFAFVEGLRGKIRGRVAAGSALLLLAGLWIFRSPDLAALAGLTPAVIAALCLRNLAGTGSEAAERHGAASATVRFNALRFVWLAGAGVPLAVAVLILTGRIESSLALIAQALPVALPLHMLTMSLTFGGGFYRTQAKACYPLTLCSAVNALPLVLTPLVALAANSVFQGLFPTTVASVHLFLGSLLVVTAVVWLAASNHRPGPPPQVETLQS